ncbi:MAG: trypsin-like peptidase domain-containing protein [Saprospiraceae bacterium]|nr:MAG: hypothetical protein UZ08_BCD001001344 [Candidatus Parvibacillus calidus]MCC7147583.1 trypsin-like peptidase domain-containing protein [Saprospiraceae bacterium]
MRFIILSLSLFLFTNFVSAQKQVILYYDGNGIRSSKAECAYYKVINYNKAGKIIGKIKDFYKSGEGYTTSDGAKEINRDNDNKSVYWGKQIRYYKSGAMKAIRLFSLDGDIIYEKKWYSSGKIKSFGSYKTKYGSTFIEFAEDGSIIASYRNRKGEGDPRVFVQKDNQYLIAFMEDFSTNQNRQFWEYEMPLEEGQFEIGVGYHIITEQNGHFAKILPFSDSFDDSYMFSTNIGSIKGDKNTFHGIVYDYSGPDQFSCFGINGMGKFCIYHVNKSKSFFEVPITDNSNINTGRNNNNLTIQYLDEKISFLINDVEVYTSNKNEFGEKYFGLFSDGGRKDVVFQNISLLYLNEEIRTMMDDMIVGDGAFKTGTGFIIDDRGYMITNHHVIENADFIEVEFKWEGKTKTFPARIVSTDKEKDLSILRIISNDFKLPKKIPYAIEKADIPTGSEVFTLGYPEAFNMGREVKFTDGKISALSGIKNNKSVYQTSIPARGGNSGGAVFGPNGNIIGVLYAVRSGSEVYSYAIKSSVLIEFIHSFNKDIVITRPNTIKNQPLVSKVNTLKDYVALVKVW